MEDKNAFCHIEIPAPDLNKAKKFYKNVFGWEVELEEDKTYAFFKDGSIGGGFDPNAKPSDDGVKLVLTVEDIREKLVEIEKAGGKKIKGKTEIPGGYGYFADFMDTNGNKLSIWSKV